MDATSNSSEHKLFRPRLTLLNRNSLNKNKIFLQLSLLLRGMKVLNADVPCGIVDLLTDMSIGSLHRSCVVSVV